jgi:hypothetical protein
LLELDVIFLQELLPTDDLEPTHHTPELLMEILNTPFEEGSSPISGET